MARTEYVPDTTGETLYAKSQELVETPWPDDRIVGVENGTTGSYKFVLPDDNADYFVYRQLGGSPLATDEVVGVLPKVSGSDATLAKQDEIIGYINTEVAAIKANTDQLTFTVANQLDVSIVTNGNGARSVTATLSDDEAVVVAGSVVNVRTSAGVDTGIFGTTNSLGVVTFQLDDGIYKFAVSDRAGYESHTAETKTISTDDQAITLTVTKTAGAASGVGWIG